MMTEKSLDPCSLVLREMCCFYCGKEGEEDLRETQIKRLFGLRHCAGLACSTAAARDCNAYLHTHKMVPMVSARRNPAISAFISLLETRHFLVPRTNGAADPGWKPNFGSISKEEFIQYIVGMWTVPLVKDNALFKNVPIINFTDPHLADAVFAESAVAAIAELEAGIFAKDAAAAALLPKGVITETRGVTTIIVDGAPCRVVSCIMPNTTPESCPVPCDPTPAC